MKLQKRDVSALLSAAALLALAVPAWLFLDQPIFSWLWHHRDALPDSHILKILEMLGKAWLLIWLLLCWVSATGRLRPALVVFLALLIVAPAVFSVKQTVRRPRPYDVTDQAANVDYQRSDLIRSWSFPSGDTATAFAVTLALSAFLRRRWLALLLVVSTAVGLLRILVFAHYLSDVLVGAAVGIFSGLLALTIRQKWEPLRSLDIDRFRKLAFAGVILVPLAAGFFESWGFTFEMLTTYGLLVIIVFVACNARKLFFRT